MSEDFVMWDIDGLLASYNEIPEWKANVENTLTELFRFLEKNQLLSCKVTSADGEVVKRIIRYSELTEDGRKISCGSKNPVHRWLASKGGQRNPPDMKILEKALIDIRSNQ